METLSNSQLAAAELADWRRLGQALHAVFAADDYAGAAAFVAAVAEAADAADHHPDLTLTWGRVDATLATHEGGLRVTQRDVDLARTISAIAARQGLRPEPGQVVQLELGLDTADGERLGPFWSALLTGSPDHVAHGNVLDPAGRLPVVWFQSTEPHETPRQRWHGDLWIAPEVLEERIAAAVAAGGTVVDDSEAPSFTVLADADGNRVCLCTSLER